MRLIDADELLEQLETLLKKRTEEARYCGYRGPTVTWNDALYAIINAPTVDSVKHGRWIPCNERLPEIGDAYIVTGIQKDAHEKEWHYFVDVASSHGDYIDDYWDTFNDWIEGQETHIVAWMPLPKPYKMDEVSE